MAKTFVILPVVMLMGYIRARDNRRQADLQIKHAKPLNGVCGQRPRGRGPATV